MGTTPMSLLRIQRRRTKGWRMPSGVVYVGRPGRWGNPYGRYLEDAGGWRDEAVLRYRADLTDILNREPGYLISLRGHDLACWCALCDDHAEGKPFGVQCDVCPPCHADVLGELAN